MRFNEWASKLSKTYKNSVEHDKRFEEFAKKDNKYNLINSNPKNTFKVGHN